ncbi:MAG: L,D-transpeptidase family protein [Dehalococcoidia bacterium]
MRDMRGRVLSMLAVLLVAVAVLGAAGCGGNDDATPTPPVVIETPEVTPVAAVETPPAVVATAEPTVVATVPPTVAATQAPRPAGPPQSGQWIDVNLSTFTVRLMDGTSALRTIGPVGVGAQINTGVYESTRTGLFYVYSMDASLTYDAPYDTYISHWVGFDPGLDNGFHSFLKDAEGQVVDPSTGRISNGCIRTGEAEAIYAFAEIGMPVWVHL